MKKQQLSPREAASAAPEQNVDKIREIIFGGHMRDYEQRFTQLEKRLATTQETLSRELSGKIDRLESFMRKEFDKLSERWATEHHALKTENEEHRAYVEELEREFEARFADLDEQLSVGSAGLQKSLEEATGKLMDLIRENRDQLSMVIDKQARSLDTSKVAREDLAAMLSEVAKRLQNDGKA